MHPPQPTPTLFPYTTLFRSGYPMTALADLHRAVQSTLASKRLGRPVFVRYLLCSRDRAEAALPRLVQLTAAVRDWFGQPLERLHANGSPKSGQVSLTLEFRGGGTALV